MHPLIWAALLTVGAGVSVFVQQALNANLRTELNSAAWSGFVSYLLGVVFMVCLAIVLRDPIPSGSTMGRVPGWAWSGGIRRDLHRPLDHHDSKGGWGRLHRVAGDRTIGRRARV